MRAIHGGMRWHEISVAVSTSTRTTIMMIISEHRAHDGYLAGLERPRRFQSWKECLD